VIVADGVGGWANKGIDSGKFSRALTARAKETCGENNQADLLAALTYACANPETGSSTAVMGVLDKKTLRTINLGDSGYALFRPRQEDLTKLDLIFRSEE